MTGGVDCDFESQESKIATLIHGQLFKPFGQKQLVQVLKKIDFNDKIDQAA